MAQQNKFNDGVANFYQVGNIAIKGNKPEKGLKQISKVSIRYSEEIVGMSRYWAAKQDNVKIDRMIKLPRVDCINANQVVVLTNGLQYKIKQIQYKKEDIPVMALSLEEIGELYEVG